MEGSLRAVNRTASAADVSVGFNVFPRYRDSVSESYPAAAMGDGGRMETPVPEECRESFSEIRWYHGF